MRPANRCRPRPGRCRVRAALAVLLLPIGVVFAGGGQEAREAQARQELITDLSVSDTDPFVVAIAAVVSPELRDSDRLMLGSYTQVLRDLASTLETRYLSPAEQRALAQSRIDQRRDSLQDRLDERRRSIERRRLEEGPDDDAPSFATDDTATDVRTQLKRLDTLSPPDISVPASRPLSFLDAGYRARRVLPGAQGLAAELPEADMLLYLRVETLGEARLVELWSYHAGLQRSQEVFRTVVDAEDVSTALETFERPLVAELAGEPLGRVTVEVEDSQGRAQPEARVLMGDRFLGVAPVTDPQVRAGTYTVYTELPDGRSAQRRIDLSPGEDQRVSLVITTAPPRQVQIHSIPAGARVYRGALWQGFTPLAVPVSSTDISYTISRDGYYDSRVTVGPDAPARIERVLVSTDQDWAAEVQDARDRFYRSFGAFALSVGAPILLNGAYQNYNGLVDSTGALDPDLSSSEQDQIVRRTNTLLVGYYTSLGLSAGLFGNMIVRLVRYVRTAQGYHTR